MVLDQGGSTGFLSYARFRFTLRFRSLTLLPPYKGAVFRGAFGTSLRRLLCVSQQSNCQPCLLRDRCLYMALFEPTPPPGYHDAGKFQQAPRPYVLNPPLIKRQVFHPGEDLDFEMVLFGQATAALPYFIYIFQEIGRRGLGPKRGLYELLQVSHLNHKKLFKVFDSTTSTLAPFNPETGPPEPLLEDQSITQVSLTFLTPLRLKAKGDLVTCLTFPILFERLTQRLALLAGIYNSPRTQELDFISLTAKAKNVAVARDEMHWHDWERYSRRQDAAMKFGGLAGKITFSGPLGPFMPYLRLGEAVNVGQATTFGLGRYRLRVEVSDE